MLTEGMSCLALLTELILLGLVLGVGRRGLHQLDSDLRGEPLNTFLLLAEIVVHDFVLGLLTDGLLGVGVQESHQLVVVIPGDRLHGLSDEVWGGDQLVLFPNCLQIQKQQPDSSFQPQELNFITLGGIRLMLDKLIDELGGDSAAVGVLVVEVGPDLLHGGVVVEVVIVGSALVDGGEQEGLVILLTDVLLPFTTPPWIVPDFSGQLREGSLGVVVHPSGDRAGGGVLTGVAITIIDAVVGSTGGDRTESRESLGF